MSFRDIKKRARSDLHRAMRVQTALYRTGPSGPSETVYCRLNSKITPSGDLKGTSLAYAETVETEPRLIFLREEHRPARTWVYVLEAGEAYRVDHVEPDDTITVTAVCTRLSKEDVAAYEPPYGG